MDISIETRGATEEVTNGIKKKIFSRQSFLGRLLNDEKRKGCPSSRGCRVFVVYRRVRYVSRECVNARRQMWIMGLS